MSPDVMALLILATIVMVILVKEVISKWFAAPNMKGADALKMLMKKKKNMARASGHCLCHYLSASITASLFLSLSHCLYHRLSVSLPHSLYHSSITASLFLSLPLSSPLFLSLPSQFAACICVSTDPCVLL